MYIESFEKSSKRPSRGVTPKASFSALHSKQTPSNARAVSSSISPGYTATSFTKSSPPPQKVESRLFQLLSGNSRKLTDESVTFNTTSDAFIATVVPQPPMKVKTTRRSLLLPQTQTSVGTAPTVSSSSYKNFKSTFVIADDLSACKVREKSQLSKIYSISMNSAEQKKPSRRQSTSLNRSYQQHTSNGTSQENNQQQPKTFAMLADERFSELNYYNTSGQPKAPNSQRDKKGVKARQRQTNYSSHSLIQNNNNDVRSSTSTHRFAPVDPNAQSHKKPKFTTLPSQNLAFPSASISVAPTPLSQHPSSQQFPRTISFDHHSPPKSNSAHLHPRGAHQVESLDNMQNSINQKSPDQRALIAATKESSNPIDQIDELKQIYMLEQQNISAIISKGMKALESKEMIKTIEANTSTRFSEYNQEQEIINSNNPYARNPTKEDLNKTGLLGAYEAYNRMSKHEIIEKLLVSEHIMKSLYKKNKLLSDQLNQYRN